MEQCAEDGTERNYYIERHHPYRGSTPWIREARVLRGTPIQSVLFMFESQPL
jgi:hypothetical protein